MRFPLDWLLLNKWLWITIFGCWLVMIGPVIFVYFMLFLPPPIKMIVFFGIIVGWGVAGGYKDWVMARRKEVRFPVPRERMLELAKLPKD